ncbi:hypothetical protein [Myroides odoratimimus]|uniref:TIGR04255 family protein n=1 Tax=Myroides odoratimimus CIP 101113 TaxID=883154 RepID=A0AAV3F6P5_9FLAO|nr:hypothetical protein [Myroides odoratimimus]EHO14688.1 hypothetical protein HMPREF9715_00573 [Myroides odoratimimus CIP 101113]
MKKNNLELLASLFITDEKFEVTNEFISKMLVAFKVEGFLPNIFQEMSINDMSTVNRLSLISLDKNWEISFIANRINIEYKNKDTTNYNISNFCEKSASYFDKIMTTLDLKGCRLSCFSNLLIHEIEPNKLDMIPSKLFKKPNFFNDVNPFEWNWRSATRSDITISNISEKINVITNINRITGEIKNNSTSTYFDGISIAIDLNTLYENSENRFDNTSVHHFFNNIKETNPKIELNITDFIFN